MHFKTTKMAEASSNVKGKSSHSGASGDEVERSTLPHTNNNNGGSSKDKNDQKSGYESGLAIDPGDHYLVRRADDTWRTC